MGLWKSKGNGILAVDDDRQLAAVPFEYQNRLGYRYKLALELMRLRQTEIDDRDEYIYDKTKQMEIIKALEEAIRLNPFNAYYHERLGWEYTYLWREADYYQKWLPAADISMDRAAYFGGVKSPHQHVNLGHYWTMRSKGLNPADSRWRQSWEKACRHFKKAQEIDGNSQMVKTVIKYIWIFYPDETFVFEALEDRFYPEAKRIMTD